MDPRIVGAYISNKRKNRNLTQLELAQMLNVSHQAISKWERGESLPDISILPQLSRVFEVTIDALLNGKADANIEADPVHAVEAVEIHRVAANGASSVEGIAVEVDRAARDEGSAAHVAKMQTVTADVGHKLDRAAAASGAQELDKPAVTIDHLVSLAPFVSQEALEAMVARFDGSINLPNLSALAPFLSKATLGALVARSSSDSAEAWQPHHLVSLAPFLEPTALTGLIRQCAIEAFDAAILTSLAPFMEQSELARLVERLEADVPPGLLAALAPFLPRMTMDRLALRVLG